MKVYRRQSREARLAWLAWQQATVPVSPVRTEGTAKPATRTTPFPESRPRRPASRYLAMVVATFLVLTLAHRLATRAAGSTPTTATTAAIELPAVAGRSVRIIRPTTALEAIRAPHTVLALALTGILLGADGLPSTAIIAADEGNERAYGVGESIDHADGAILHSLYADRAILDRGDRLETLRLNSTVGEATTPELSAALGLPSNEPQVPSTPATDAAP